LRHLVDAWPRVLQDWPSARLWLVGAGDDEAALRGQIQSRGLSNYIALPGMFDSLDDILAAADLYVLPSFEEGMSIGLLEAMARGLPSVASDIPGNRAVAQHKVTSYLVPPGDSLALARAIRHVWSDPGLSDAMGHAAQEFLIRRFSIEQMARRHLELFEQLVSGHKPRRDQNPRPN